VDRVTDPLDLARRLWELALGPGDPGAREEDYLMCGAADLIESQHAEIERLRAIEKAARGLFADVEDVPCMTCGRDTTGYDREYGHDPDCSWNALNAVLCGEKHA